MKSLLKKITVPLYLKAVKIYTLNINKYHYNPDNYIGCFLSTTPKVEEVILNDAEEVIYIFWTGNNEISENRLKGIESIRNVSEVKVVLVTPNNLNEFILKDFPLHPAYNYLSLVHKSDYLRCYFMLHNGGGYVDIKPCLSSWKNLFEELNATIDKWCIAPREKYVGGVPDIEGSIGVDIKKYHNNLISNGAFIYKPNSPIANEWMREAHKRLDILMPTLVLNPGGQYGGGNYPIPWSYLMAQIMHPLILKYHERIICKDIDLFSIENYR
jgi:hypothetical protein